MKFIKAACYTPGRVSNPRLVVIHTAETHERNGMASVIGRFFAGELGPVRVSSHYVVDANEVVQCVHEHDRAWHAPGVNGISIGVEHAGFAAQGSDAWIDAYSSAMLLRSAALVREICDRWAIPTRHVDAQAILDGQAGICGHDDVSAAYIDLGNHSDPGPSFPWVSYLERVRGDAAEINV